ncbi:phosphoglycerate mutase [Grosmannia clavigera kw1407]|uniref:Phosphoglycerate mutase n=1 Tax=Grosmannia clavigera (strain kw1407 / UAMH 11150) TaxID=655863 RepID=F0XDX7_GROCL|nr:phosphoglycerate mutase [Grosmannia clavigera kw1407]EFX03890.1 phosphoglycerate mutase [Grosmannia clavigera kw1407]
MQRRCTTYRILFFPAHDWALRDPGLTERGFQQSRQLGAALQQALPGRFDVQLVLVSPMRRTLQTAVEALDWLVGPSAAAAVPIRAHAGWQETTEHACDIGSDTAVLALDFPGVDFADVDPVFPDKTSPQAKAYAYSRQALVTRAQTVLEELHGRPEDVVLVVSHSAFLSRAVAGAMFGNADYRIFSFEDSETSADTTPRLCPPPMAVPGLPPLRYRLREWDETRQSHGGMGWSYDTVRAIGEGLPDRG